MDTISILLGALISGAATATKATASKAIKDCYAGLKHLIITQFKGFPELKDRVNALEQKPFDEVLHHGLRERLTKSGLDPSDELINLAFKLIKLIDDQASEDTTVALYIKKLKSDLLRFDNVQAVKSGGGVRIDDAECREAIFKHIGGQNSPK